MHPGRKDQASHDEWSDAYDEVRIMEDDIANRETSRRSLDALRSAAPSRNPSRPQQPLLSRAPTSLSLTRASPTGSPKRQPRRSVSVAASRDNISSPGAAVAAALLPPPSADSPTSSCSLSPWGAERSGVFSEESSGNKSSLQGEDSGDVGGTPVGGTTGLDDSTQTDLAAAAAGVASSSSRRNKDRTKRLTRSLSRFALMSESSKGLFAESSNEASFEHALTAEDEEAGNVARTALLEDDPSATSVSSPAPADGPHHNSGAIARTTSAPADIDVAAGPPHLHEDRSSDVGPSDDDGDGGLSGENLSAFVDYGVQYCSAALHPEDSATAPVSGSGTLFGSGCLAGHDSGSDASSLMYAHDSSIMGLVIRDFASSATNITLGAVLEEGEGEGVGSVFQFLREDGAGDPYQVTGCLFPNGDVPHGGWDAEDAVPSTFDEQQQQQQQLLHSQKQDAHKELLDAGGALSFPDPSATSSDSDASIAEATAAHARPDAATAPDNSAGASAPATSTPPGSAEPGTRLANGGLGITPDTPADANVPVFSISARLLEDLELRRLHAVEHGGSLSGVASPCSSISAACGETRSSNDSGRGTMPPDPVGAATTVAPATSTVPAPPPAPLPRGNSLWAQNASHARSHNSSFCFPPSLPAPTATTSAGGSTPTAAVAAPSGDGAQDEPGTKQGASAGLSRGDGALSRSLSTTSSDAATATIPRALSPKQPLLVTDPVVPQLSGPLVVPSLEGVLGRTAHPVPLQHQRSLGSKPAGSASGIPLRSSPQLVGMDLLEHLPLPSPSSKPATAAASGTAPALLPSSDPGPRSLSVRVPSSPDARSFGTSGGSGGRPMAKSEHWDSPRTSSPKAIAVAGQPQASPVSVGRSGPRSSVTTRDVRTVTRRAGSIEYSRDTLSLALSRDLGSGSGTTGLGGSAGGTEGGGGHAGEGLKKLNSCSNMAAMMGTYASGTDYDYMPSCTGSMLGSYDPRNPLRSSGAQPGSTLMVAMASEVRSVRSGSVLDVLADGSVEAAMEDAILGSRRLLDAKCSLLDEVRVDRILGFGSMGVVYFGRLWDHQVVVKLIEHGTGVLGKEQNRGRLARAEASVSRLLQHPNVVTTYDCCTGAMSAQRLAQLLPKSSAAAGSARGAGRTRYMTMIVQEYCELGTLRDVIARKKCGMDNSQPAEFITAIQRVALDIANGMKYLASLRLIHADLKAENILMQACRETSEHPLGFVAKIADFGLIQSLPPDSAELHAGIHGTVSHMPPEAMKRGAVFSLATDVYSYGVVLWELYTQDRPFAGRSAPQVVSAVVEEGQRPAWPEDVPPAYRRLAEACWSTDPRLRPDFHEIVVRLREMLHPAHSLMGRLEEARDSVRSSGTDVSDELEAALRQQHKHKDDPATLAAAAASIGAPDAPGSSGASVSAPLPPMHPSVPNSPTMGGAMGSHPSAAGRVSVCGSDGGGDGLGEGEGPGEGDLRASACWSKPSDPLGRMLYYLGQMPDPGAIQVVEHATGYTQWISHVDIYGDDSSDGGGDGPHSHLSSQHGVERTRLAQGVAG